LVFLRIHGSAPRGLDSADDIDSGSGSARATRGSDRKMNIKLQPIRWFRPHCSAWTSRVCLALLFTLAIARETTGQLPQDGQTDLAGLVLTIEGKAEVARSGDLQWSVATTNLSLKFGDRLRTGPQSRATVRLSDLSILRVNEKTVLEIHPQTSRNGSILDLKSGSSYFFNRSKPASLQFRTPLISGAIRGTEFNLTAEEDGATTVTLLEGEVALTNSMGGLILTSGEQGIAKPGVALRKTAVLQTINIIQWSLYYPAVLDLDELALTQNEQTMLASSLEAYRLGDLLGALNNLPKDFSPASDSQRIYLAALVLAVGQVEQADAALASLQ